MRVYIRCDGAAMPRRHTAGAGRAVVGGVRLLGSEALGDATNNVASARRFGTRCGPRPTPGATSASRADGLAGGLRPASLGHRVRGPST